MFSLRKYALPTISSVLAALLLSACGGAVDPNQQANQQLSSKRSGQIVAADEYNNVVQRIYLAYFGRPADPAGMAYWADQYRTAAMPTELGALRVAYGHDAVVRSLVDVFALSQESIDLYPGDNDTFINAIYRNLFSRDADAAGQVYWVDLLNRGVMTRANAALALMDGALGTDRSTIEQKLGASARFTAALDTPARLAAYSGNSATALARAMLLDVVHSTELDAFQASIMATIAALNALPVGPTAYLGFLTELRGDTGVTGYALVPTTGGAAIRVNPKTSFRPVHQLQSATIAASVRSNVRTVGQVLWHEQNLVLQDWFSNGGVPARTQVSNLKMSSVCEKIYQPVGTDMVVPLRSRLFFQTPGADGTCATGDDGFVSVRLDASPTSAPEITDQPLAVRYHANGSVAGYLMRKGQMVQLRDANLANPVTLFTAPGTTLRALNNKTENWHTFVFATDAGLYAWDLNASTAGAPVKITSLYGDVHDTAMASIDNGELFVVVRHGDTIAIVRYDTRSQLSTQLASIDRSSEFRTGLQLALTPTQVVLYEASTDTISAVPRRGGSAQRLYRPAQRTPSKYAFLQTAGERIWTSNFWGDDVVSLQSDGTGLAVWPSTHSAGCIYRSSYPVGEEGCDALLITRNGELHAYDAATGALRLRYGSIVRPPYDEKFPLFMHSYTTWGDAMVLTYYYYHRGDGRYANHDYYLVTDRSGLQLITPRCARVSQLC